MDIQTVAQDFITCGHKLPKAAMQWTLDHWAECEPYFLTLFESFLRGDDRSKDTTDVLFFALHLMGQQRVNQAFGPLCALAGDTDLLEQLLGEDGSIEYLPRLLVSTYDGRSELLKALIENAEADEFVRSRALTALAYLTYLGDVALQTTRSYLHWLHQSLQPRTENMTYVGVADAIIALGFVDDRNIVRDLLARGLIPRDVMDMRFFDKEIARILADPERRAGFDRSNVAPCADIIAEMSTWYWFTEAAEREELEAQQREKQQTALKFAELLEAPHAVPYGMAVDPLGSHKQTSPGAGKIGRNDPCPCGSGKKYKKCCLP